MLSCVYISIDPTDDKQWDRTVYSIELLDKLLWKSALLHLNINTVTSYCTVYTVQ